MPFAGIADARQRMLNAVSSPLPLELVDQVLDYASYWAHSSITVEWDKIVPKMTNNDSGSISDKIYMRTLPLAVYGTQGDVVLTEKHWTDGEAFHLGAKDSKMKYWFPSRGKHPCRVIEFNLWSSDQG